jgi:hypothetical protein
MLDAVYIDTKKTKSIIALRPKAPFRPIFEVATRKQNSVIQIRKGRENESQRPSLFLVEAGESRTQVNPSQDLVLIKTDLQRNLFVDRLLHYESNTAPGYNSLKSVQGQLIFELLEQLTNVGKIAEKLKSVLTADSYE